jgi:hypothetical protein
VQNATETVISESGTSIASEDSPYWPPLVFRVARRIEEAREEALSKNVRGLTYWARPNNAPRISAVSRESDALRPSSPASKVAVQNIVIPKNTRMHITLRKRKFSTTVELTKQGIIFNKLC